MDIKRPFYEVFLLIFTLACSDPELEPVTESPEVSPSDDPADYDVDTSVSYDVVVSEPSWLVPSDALPSEVETQTSNNNLDIVFHNNRLFLAWRTAPNHFASELTEIFIVSSSDDGETWDFEHRVDIDSDMREPRLLSYQNELQLIFFQAGTNPFAFEPVAMWRTFRRGLADWSDLERMFDDPEVPWDVKVRGDVAYMTTYLGDHYGDTEENPVQVLFRSSTDGHTWNLVDDVPYVYEGGVSETAFEFDAQGALWVVTRNEDGDDTGAGSHVCWAAPTTLATWQCPDQADPERYDSPELFRHGDDIYLVARRDIGGPFGDNPSLIDYSNRPKTTALYQVNTTTRSVEHIIDLPGAGDTAFPSVRRTGPHTFLLANYTSPLDNPNISWMQGQTSPEGTQIYLLTLTFVPTE